MSTKEAEVMAAISRDKQEPVGSPRLVEGVSDRKIVNDFSIVVATANGTGSQTANLTLLRSIFKMGIPVNGKNIFPSNIQGLPTWYFIRVSHEGFTSRRETAEILIAFNKATVEEDIAKLPGGGVCFHPSEWRDVPYRDDIVYYPIPVNRFLRHAGVRGKIRGYMTNMVYVGVFASFFGLDMEKVEEAITFHFHGRTELVVQNMAVIKAAYQWTGENSEKSDPYFLEPMADNENKILITGNEAGALGAIFGGVTLVSWYPITPSTSLIDALNDFLPNLRTDPETGKANCVVIQAEDELAAAGMVMGAGWAGARAMTATSGPGISLMAEFIGLGYFSEIPSVIWDIQRVGPSTGLPTRTSQGDIHFAHILGHGDTKNILLLPATVAECFEFGTTSFNLADELQTPVFVMSDLDLGMNTWMSKPFTYPSEPIKRGKVLDAQDVEERGFSRYLDLENDGITYRTLPGNKHPKAAYLNRGTGHNEFAVYSEKPADWADNMARLVRKFETARDMVPAPVIDGDEEAEIAIIAYGSTLPAIEEARARLRNEGLPTSFLRLRALPINDEVGRFVADHRRCYVIELNRDGQMHKILSLELPEFVNRLFSLSYMDGLPITAGKIVELISDKEVNQ
jgi:2-oxoglutarate ferredoxin oxidoreductase subunit alpha